MKGKQEAERLAHELRNGGGESLRVQSAALAEILDRLARLEGRIADIPAQMQAIVAVHAGTCQLAEEKAAMASKKAGNGGSLELGKGWLKANGKGLVVVALAIVALVALGVVLQPYLADIITAAKR